VPIAAYENSATRAISTGLRSIRETERYVLLTVAQKRRRRSTRYGQVVSGGRRFDCFTAAGGLFEPLQAAETTINEMTQIVRIIFGHILTPLFLN
jgi:hypothetical protein